MKTLSELQMMSDSALKSMLAGIDTTQIQGRALRRRFTAIRRKQGGFTLLELLVVVAILAVMGGIAIASLGDKTTQAARGAATQGIADVESKLRTYQALTTTLASNLDTMVCAEPTATDLSGAVDLGGTSNLPGVGGGMGNAVAGKLNIVTLPVGMVNALANGGIGTLRYGYRNTTDSACDNVGSTAIAAPAAQPDADFGAGFGVISPSVYPNLPLQAADIPNRVFDTPVGSGSTTNRGRGFAARIGAGTTYLGGTDEVPVQLWQRGRNQRVGAGFNDVLVTLGIGNNSTHVTDPTANKTSASPGYYGDIGRDKYGRYMALVKVATDNPLVAPTPTTGATWAQADIDALTMVPDARATLVAVVDARGDFLDEEFAEARGQKQ